MQHQSVILLAFCFLICYTGIAQINNISEDVKNSYDLTLNITNIKSKGNLMISIMTDSLDIVLMPFHLKQSHLRKILIKIISLK